MGREENLGRAGEKISHQHTLPVGFEATLDLIDNRDGCIPLVLLRNGERRKPSCSRSPARQRQLHAVALGGEPNQCRDGQTLPSGDGKIEIIGQVLLFENGIQSLERCFSFSALVGLLHRFWPARLQAASARLCPIAAV